MRQFLLVKIVRPWKRIAAFSMAVVLLMPIPAAALTFLGSWTPTVTVSGGPTPTSPTFTDVTSNGGNLDDLYVDMKTYQGATAKATSSIVLSRQFTISGSGGQSVLASEDFSDFFKHASVSVQIQVKDANNQTVIWTPLTFNASTSGNSFQKLGGTFSAINTLANGTYTVDVTVTYATDNKLGGWKKDKSVHHFEFLGE
jgi:hypothetical protein